MSLVKCFNLAKIPREERAEINASILSLTEMGMEQKPAALKVVKDLLKEAESERNNIVEFIRKNQPKEKPKETLKAVPKKVVEQPTKTEPKEQYSVKAVEDIADTATKTPEFKKWFGKSKVVDEKGNPKVVYSGHGNILMWGSKFVSHKATAGAFYTTENPDIASGYAMGKLGDKTYNEQGNQYRLKNKKTDKFNKKLWQYELTNEQLKKIEELKKDEEHEIGDMDRWIENNKAYDPVAKRMSYQGTRSLQNIWQFYEYMGYTIAYDKGESTLPITERQQKNRFEDLLDDLGIGWNSSERAQPGVMPLVLRIENPIDTSKDFPQDLLDALDKKSKYEKNRSIDYIGSTRWTKDYPLKEWVKDIKREIETGEEQYWPTHVPKKALPIIKSFGYDGIKDVGGKGGGQKHNVWMAFDANQIKSVFNLKPTEKPDIMYSTKTTFKDSNFSLKDVQLIFKGQKVGIAHDGTIFVRTRLGRGVQIKSVDTITPDKAAFEVGYSRMKASGELIAGKYQDGVITISKVGDKWTLAHESEHFLEDANFINKNDQKALSGEIKRRIRKGTWKTLNPDDIGGKEDRAEFIAQELKKRSDSRPTVQRVIQKIQDLIDAFVNLYKRTAKGVVRDVGSGKIYEKEGIPVTAPIASYEKTAQRWYSQMEKTLEQKLPGKGTPESMKQAINAFAKKGEFKAEELEFSGLLEWLDSLKEDVARKPISKTTDKVEKGAWYSHIYTFNNGVRIGANSEAQAMEEYYIDQYGTSQPEGLKDPGNILKSGKVTKQEVLTYLKENNVQIREVVKGEPSEDDIDTFLDDEAGEGYTREEAREYLQNDEGATKFPQYQEPGGENYKEVLLTLPAKGIPYKELDKRMEAKAQELYGKSYEELDHYEKDKVGRNIVLPSTEDYTGGHWEEPNVLAHMRLNERTDTEGAKVLFLEEIQSDWHQKGRQAGYKEMYKPDELNILPEEDSEGIGDTDLFWLIEAPGQVFQISKKKAATAKEAVQYVLKNKPKVSGVPDAPFKKSWPMLIIKRAVRMAAEGGFDKLGWTPGEIQAARYDLSKQIDRIEYSDGILSAYKDGNRVIDETVSKEKLPDYIGKDAAEKILKAPVETIYGDSVSGKKPLYETRKLEGLDLKTKAPGMTAFYDKMLVNEVNKFFNKKKWGKAKVGVGKIGAEGGYTIRRNDTVYGIQYEVDLNGNIAEIFETRKEAEKYIDEHWIETAEESKPIEVWVLPITPEIKQKALREGMPMFAVKDYPIAGRGEWYADADYKKRGGKLIEMSPDEFLEKAKPLKVDDIARENIDDLKRHIEGGKALDPLVIYDVDKTLVRNSDGRHRAIAAKELGIKKVSVIDFTETGKHEQYSVKKPDLDPDIQELLNKLMPEAEAKKFKKPIDLPRSKSPNIIKDKFGRTEKTPKETVIEAVEGVKTKEFWDKVATKTLDRLHPIKTFLSDKTYKLHRIETGTQAVLSMFLEHGKLKWDKSGFLTMDERKQGFLPFLKSLGKDWDKFIYWTAAKRASELDKQGREKWLNKEARDEIFKWAGGENNPKWVKASKEFKKFNSSILDIAEKAGLIDPEGRKVWEQEFYVPFYRIFEDFTTRDEFLKAPRKNKKFISAQIKRLKGANVKMGDPLENLMHNWTHLINESLRNVSRAEAFDFAAKNDLDIIEEVGVKDINSFHSSKDKKTVYVTKNTQENVLMFQRGGKPVYFKVSEPELFHAMSNVNAKHLDNFVIQLMGKAKRALTFGATFGPGFRVANLLRDTMHTAMINKSFKPFYDSAIGFKKSWMEDAEYISLMASGAGFGSSYVRADDPKTMNKYIKRIVKKEGDGVLKLILNTPKKMLDFWEKVGSASENAARVQLYSNLLGAGKTHMEAAFEARDLLDFTMRGESGTVQLLIQTIPFLNARMQGLYRLGRAVTDKENTKNFAIRGAILTAASLALWALYKDDDRWKELEDWDKWSYYHFWIGDKHFRIPKPFEVGAIFSSFPETMADVLYGNDETKHIADFIGYTARENFAIGVPQLFSPLMEQWANKSSFTGRPIVGQHLKGLKPSEQKDPWTSETIQLVAGKMNISPKRAEAIINGYFSTFGMFLLSGSDIITRNAFDFPERPARRIDDYPLVGRFIKESRPARHTKYTTWFYETLREIDESVKTLNHFERTGDIGKAKGLIKTDKDKLKWKKAFVEYRGTLSQINRRMKRILLSKKHTANQKREEIDKLVTLRNRVIKRLYEAYGKRKN